MSPVSHLSILAFASTVLASPYAHGHGHQHQHRHLHTPSGAPYVYGNSTGSWGPTGSPKVPSYASSSTDGYEEMTSTITRQSTIFQTVFQTVQGSAAPSNAHVAAAGATDVCAADVTVTSTEKVYVTVTVGGASSSTAPAPVPYGSSSSVASPVQSSSSSSYVAPPVYPAPSSSSSEAAPVSTSSSIAPAPPAYTPSSESSSVAAPVTTSSYVAPPAYTPPAESSSSSSALNIIPSISIPDKGSSPSTTASAPPSYSSAPSTGGKRGLAYNTASLLECFSGSSEVSWAYNWLSSAAGLSGYKYIPMLHSGDAVFTGSWDADAQAAIDSGSTTLFSFNEPDIPSQANMPAADAASKYRQYMNPYDGKASLCAPAVSNGPADQGQGLGWLQDFLDACNGGCNINAFNIHWYGTDVEDLKNHTSKAIEMANGKPVWVSEFAINGLTDDETDSFLKEIMPWFDSNPAVAGYAYFMAEDGKLLSGTEPSSYGTTYMSYTS